MLFVDRRDAGQQLGQRLDRYRGHDALVLGIPRGGVVVAAEVARHLKAPLDVIVPRKIGAPHNPELAVGALAPDGTAAFDPVLLRYFGYSEETLAGAVEMQREEMERRLRLYRGDRKPPVIADRTVIVVDDGVATGFTVTAALRALRNEGPSTLVLAVPVAPPEVAPALRQEVDDFVCLALPQPFYAVGQFYQCFDETRDAEVIALLNALASGNGHPARRGERGCRE
jgi:predicted phosphoribosyltransferase